MAALQDRPYVEDGNPNSQQAEHSSANPNAANVQMRILIELQVLSMMIHDAYGVTEDLAQLRKDVAASIT